MKYKTFAKTILNVSAVVCAAVLWGSVATADDPTVELISSHPGNVFIDNKAQLEIKVRSPKKVIGSDIIIVVRDESEKLVSQSHVDLTKNHHIIKLVGPGYYAVDIVGYNAKNGIKRTLDRTTVGILHSTDHTKDGIFGLWHVHGDPAAGLKAGASWTRAMRTLKDYTIDESGKAIPRPNTVTNPLLINDYSRIDTLAFGLPLYLTRYDSGNRNLYPPNNWSRFDQLVEQFAHDYKSMSPLFSLYNEPEVHWKGTDQDLVKFFNTMAISIKQVRPSIKILGPGFATIDIKRINTLAKLGLLNHLDGIAIHDYVNGSPPEGKFIEGVRRLNNVLAKVGKGDMPIYITEFGWTSVRGTWQKPVNELTQARYVARSLALLRNEGVRAAIYFCLRFNSQNPGASGFSIIHRDGTPKPAYVSFATASMMIGQSGGVPTLYEGYDGVRLFQLRRMNKDNTVLMVWEKDPNQRVFVPGGFSKNIVDMMGRQRNVSATFILSGSPYYFVPKIKVEAPPVVLHKTIVKRGESINFTFNHAVYVPEPLRIVNNQQIEIPKTTSAGTYWVLSDATNRITILPVIVTD